MPLSYSICWIGTIGKPHAWKFVAKGEYVCTACGQPMEPEPDRGAFPGVPEPSVGQEEPAPQPVHVQLQLL